MGTHGRPRKLANGGRLALSSTPMNEPDDDASKVVPAPIRPAHAEPAPDPVMDEEAVLRAGLAHLREEHADLSAAVEALEARGTDPLTVRRLKKRKLALKDRIAAIEDRLTPDIIA